MRISALIAAAVVVALVVAGVWLLTSDRPPAGSCQTVDVTVPELSAQAAQGAALFQQKCAVCHGENAAGGAAGPPLVHKIYEPGHHADVSFLLAVRQGVRQHHWDFGNMPPVPGVSEAQVGQVVTYVRELQRANGID